jgi:hypothetical protein
MIFGRLSAACSLVTNVELLLRRFVFGRGSAASALGATLDARPKGFFLLTFAFGSAVRGTSMIGIGGRSDVLGSESDDTDGSYPGIGCCCPAAGDVAGASLPPPPMPSIAPSPPFSPALGAKYTLTKLKRTGCAGCAWPFTTVVPKLMAVWPGGGALGGGGAMMNPPAPPSIVAAVDCIGRWS